MKNNKTLLKLIMAIITTILVVVLFVFILRIIKHKNENISVMINTLKDKIMQKENISIFNEKIEEVKSIQSSINNHFVDPNQIDKFVGFLEAIGVDNNGEVIVNSIEISVDNPNIINVETSIKGNFENVMKIMAIFENTPYQIDITRVYLNQDIQETIMKDGKLLKSSTLPKWQADVAFSVLSLN